jgi:hypothetical protein
MLVLSVSQSFSQTEAQKEYLRELWREKYRPAQNEKAPDDQRNLEKKAGSGEYKLSANFVADEGEPFIMVNPNDSDNVVVSFMDFGGASALNFPIYYTLDGGNAWNLSNFNAADTFDLMNPNWSIAGGGDPVFAFDDAGRLYFSWLFLASDPNNQFDNPLSMYWAWSDDKGQTWNMAADSADRAIGEGSLAFFGTQIGNRGDGVFDRQWFAVDRSGGVNDGNLYASYLFIASDSTNLPGDGICVRVMRPGALKWDSTHFVGTATAEVQFSNIAVDGNGKVHLTYGTTDASGTATSVKHTISTDAGQTWGFPSTVANINYPRAGFFSTGLVHPRENANPNMALNPATDDVYMVFGNVTGTSIEGFFSYSTDEGLNWSQPLNIASLRNQNVQVLMPSVAANEQGVVTMSWFELDANDVGEFWIAESFDGGVSWDPPTQLSVAQTDFTGSSQQTFYGDYYTSVRSGCTTWSAWSDGRNNIGPKLYIAKSTKCSSTPVSVTELSPLTTAISLGNLYPNPTSGVLNLELNLESDVICRIDLYDLQGKMVKRLEEKLLVQGSNEVKFNVSELSAGSYLLKIDTELGMITRQVVKQ